MKSYSQWYTFCDLFSCRWYFRELNCMLLCQNRVTHDFQIESKLYSCLNVTELLAQSRHHIWSLSDCNLIRTHNNLVRKRKLNHLAKLSSLAKWLSVCLRTKWLWVWITLLSFRELNFFHFLLCYIIRITAVRNHGFISVVCFLQSASWEQTLATLKVWL